MPKHIALPCPSEPIVAHHRPALDIIARVRHHPERVELEHIPPELLEEARPRYAQEGSNACVAYEVRDVWIPTLRTSNISTSTEPLQSPPKDKKKKGGGRLTCVPPRLQTQGYSAQMPSRANEPQRKGHREKLPHAAVQRPHHQKYCPPTAPRRPQTTQAASCAPPPLAADCDKP
jgi:hypothetical protein